MAADGDWKDVTAAVAAAGAAGGGVVMLGRGVYEMHNSSLQLPHNVKLVGVSAAATTLQWSQPTIAPMFANAGAGEMTRAAATRYGVFDLTVAVTAPSSGAAFSLVFAL